MNRPLTPGLPFPPGAIPATRPQSLWCILALMVVSVAINYIDRGSLSTAAPLLATDMAIPPKRLGWLLSAFFWSYALLQVVSGRCDCQLWQEGNAEHVATGGIGSITEIASLH